jgi:hypothetical protein
MPVDKSQAGLSLRCRCGADVAVPTLRGFGQLEQSASEQKPARSEWGLKQALLFVGSAISGPALLVALGLWLTQPRLPPQHLDAFLEAAGSTEDLDTMASSQIRHIWKEAQQGPEYFASEIIAQYDALMTLYREVVTIYHQRLGASIAAAVLGALIFGAAFVVPRAGARRRSSVGS